MKPISEIIKTREFANHAFVGALCSYACEPSEGLSLYHDSFTNRAIIYHIKTKYPFAPYDECALYEIPSYLDKMVNVDKTFYDKFMNIYTLFIKIAEEFNFNKDDDFTISQLADAYGCTDFGEVWASKEFKDAFSEKKAQITKRLDEVQDLVKSL